MNLISMRLPIAAIVGATLMAYRAYDIAPSSTEVQVEMAGWTLIGGFLIFLGVLWEAVRAYLKLNERHANG